MSEGRRGPHLDRRTFLKAAAAPLVLPGTLFGANPPSEQHSMGFIGIGKMAQGHLGHFLGRKEVRVIAACDVWDHRVKRTLDQVKNSRGADAAARVAALADCFY